MYTSPISLLISDTTFKVDETIFQAARSVAPKVDKEELIRALAYDREQYEKGYHDGVIDSRKHGKWIKNGWSIRCSECGYDMPYTIRNFCPNCGAKMDLEG